MRIPSLLAALCLASAASAQDPAPVRDMLEKIGKALNAGDAEALGAAFAKDCDVWLADRRIGEGPAAARQLIAQPIAPARPWSELSPLLLSPVAIRFVSPGVALVDAQIVRHGLAASQSRPLWLVLRREQGEWKVASFRLF